MEYESFTRGSSGGAAAAVASGIVPIAGASDGGVQSGFQPPSADYSD